MKNILILEDSELESKILCTIVKSIGVNCNIFECTTCEKAYFLSMEQIIHLFLIDIRLENDSDFSGFKFVQNIRHIDKYNEVPIIFISSVQGYELMAFRRMHCYDFISKPFNANDVKSIINNALQLRVMDRIEECLNFEVKGIYYTVNPSDILYIESNQRILYIHTESDVLELVGQSLKACYSKLNRALFRQIHKSFIVSRKHISRIEKGKRVVYIDNGSQVEKVPIGLKYLDGLWEWLNGI